MTGAVLTESQLRTWLTRNYILMKIHVGSLDSLELRRRVPQLRQPTIVLLE